MNDQISRTLAEHLRISDVDIRERKELLGLTDSVEQELFGLRDASLRIVDAVVDEFYTRQISVPRIRNIIGDSDTLSRLRSAMRTYILNLFEGDYGSQYVNSRLRIGKVHARIGVPPKLYVSSLHQLETILGAHLMRAESLEAPPAGLSKIFLFDLQFVFDTYIQGLVAEVELARDELITYSESLEETVAERTAEIERLAQTDELTGLRSRRNFFTQASKELAAAKRRNGKLTLAFIDLDNFKAVNDNNGHCEGDRILQVVGKVLNGNLRHNDMAFRYGGDEFCILLPETSQADAKNLLLKLSRILTNDLKEDIEFSAGLATAQNEYFPDVDILVSEADAAMYSVKHQRRPSLVSKDSA